MHKGNSIILPLAGLIDSDWGGTPIEAWSSIDALSQCNKATQVNVARTRPESDDWYTFYHRYVEPIKP